MEKYTKIHTVYKRDENNKHKTLIEGAFSLPEFEYLKDNTWVFTEKVDGTNIRVGWDGKEIKIGGKTDNAQIHTCLYDALIKLFLNEQDRFAEVFGHCNCDVTGEDINVCLYGEGYGAKIQKGGGNYREDQGFVLFDVKIGPWWLQRKDVEDVAGKLGIDVVPIVREGTLATMVNMARTGFMSTWGAFMAEGIVAKPKCELVARNGSRVITKIKTKDFSREAKA